MTAEIHLNGRREPAQLKSIRIAHQECGFRKIHFSRVVLHPNGVAHGRQHTNSSRIARKRFCRESVDLHDGQWHNRTHAIVASASRIGAPLTVTASSPACRGASTRVYPD